MEGVERVWHRRLRWRLRGAWQWPTFVVLTAVDAVLLTELPFYEDGPGGLVPAVLLSGFLNLFLVAVLAPFAGRLLRRARPDLPRLIAGDYSGTALLCAATALLVAGGLLHRSDRLAEDADERAVAASVHDYVVSQAPEYAGALGAMDAVKLLPGEYRACVPSQEPRRALCLFVSTDQNPPGLVLDTEQVPNDEWRRGGF
jgi:hypothetical protein